MRVKQLWVYFPLPSHIKLVWDRITTSRLTIAYFLFSFCHFVSQVAFQSKAFAINQAAATFLYDVVLQGNTTTNGFAALADDLRICETAPPNFSTNSCRVVWNGSPRENSIAIAAVSSAPFSATTVPATETASSVPSTTPSAAVITSTFAQPSASAIVTSSLSVSRASVSAVPTSFPINNSEDDDDDDISDTESLDSVSSGGEGSSISDENDLEERWALLDEREEEGWKVLTVTEDGRMLVKLNGMGFDNADAILDRSCLWALNWPVIMLHNTKREDIVFIAFQVWVLGMSAVALLNESIPHIVAALLAHLLSTIWSAFQISHTANFRSEFNRLVTDGACKGTRLLTGYWQERGVFEIIALSFNIVFLLLSGFFTYRLVKLFGWQTFKRIGASLFINRVYKIVLSLSIVIQVSLFFMAVTAGIWIDQLYNGAIGHLATMHILYKVMFIITLVLLVPWIITGWLAARREMKWCMFAFLVITIWYMAGLSSMFFATTFRWTFIQWRFFSVMVCASMVFALLSFVLGLVARCYFGRGLKAYLNAQEPLPDDFAPVSGAGGDIEKFDFPSNEGPIPTFSATFGGASASAYVSPSEWKLGPSRGPRFYSSSTEPVDRSQSISPISTLSSGSVSAPSMAYTKPRSAADESHGSVAPLQRYNSDSTERTSNHYRSDSLASSSSTGSRTMYGGGMNGKRWVIEE